MDRLIKQITDLTDFIDSWDLIKAVPVADIPPETILQRCLSREYQGRLCYVDGQKVGICIYRDMKPFLHIVALNLKGHAKAFYDAFFNGLKSEGYTRVSAVTKRDSEGYERFSGFKKQWSMYHKDL